ncbi:MAG: hypothetical protein M1817_003163 [Caeruleum heppii]|nr:MAG: hypothetical protein M1817_003163 [Caeruleum heppii]
MSQQKPMDKTRFWKVVLPLTVRLLHRWTYSPSPGVVMLPGGLVVKYGSRTYPSEAHAMSFVAEHTDIPVPRVIVTFTTNKGVRYILMSRCKGRSLGSVFHTLSPDERRAAFDQLRGYIDQLRSVPSPQPGRIAATDFSALTDYRIQREPCGPFDRLSDFHKALREGIEGHSETGHFGLDQLIVRQEARDYAIKLTHGDLSLRNMTYYKGRITGIVDWEMAGWLPEYFEYTNACDAWWDGPKSASPDDFLTPYPRECEMEVLRRSLFGLW